MSPHLPPELFAAFDRGGDPLDDVHVQEWLARHPEHLAEFANLRARLCEVSSVPTSQGWPRVVPAWRRPVVLVAVAVVAAILWRTATASPSLPMPRLAPPSAVHSVVVRSSTTAAGQSVVETFARGNLTACETSLRTFPATSTSAFKTRSSLSVQHSVAP